MKRNTVMYLDARGKECICEKSEWDAVWKSHPGVKFLAAGEATYPDHQESLIDYVKKVALDGKPQQRSAPEFDDTKPVQHVRGRVGPNADIWGCDFPLEYVLKEDKGIFTCELPSNALPLNARMDGSSFQVFFHLDDYRAPRWFKKRFFVTTGNFEPVRGLVLDFTRQLHFLCPHGYRYYVFPIVEAPQPA